MHAARNADATERFAPRDGVRLVAGGCGKGVRHARAPPDKAVNVFLDVDERMFHGVESISRPIRWRKPARRFPRGEEVAVGAGDAPERLKAGKG